MNINNIIKDIEMEIIATNIEMNQNNFNEIELKDNYKKGLEYSLKLIKQLKK